MNLYQRWTFFRGFGNGPLHALRKAWIWRRKGRSVFIYPRADGAISPDETGQVWTVDRDGRVRKPERRIVMKARA